MKEVRIVMILDESGSMEDNKKEIIQTINNFITEQQTQKANDECKFSLVKFSHNVTTLLDDVPLEEVLPIIDSNYVPTGMTALYDAIGMTITRFSEKNNVILVIVTDGQDNTSKSYNRKQIKEILDEKVNPDTFGWNAIYLCADPTLESQGDGIGISNTKASRGYSNLSAGFIDLVPFTEKLSKAVSSYRAGQTSTVRMSTD